MTPKEHTKEIVRRYDINNDKTLTYEEAKEWVYCFAPFLEENPDFGRLETPEDLGTGLRLNLMLI